MTNKSFEELCEGYLHNQLSQEELAYFLQLIQQQGYQERLQRTIEQLLNRPASSGQPPYITGDAIFQNIMRAGAREQMEQEGKLVALEEPAKTFPWIKIAAVLALVLTAVAWFYFNHSTGHKMALTETKQARHDQDMLPGGDKAVLTLADGSVMVLDNARNGMITQQGYTTVKKQDGQLIYDVSRSPKGIPEAVSYNTLSTPRGGQYQIILPDGTKVWLNAVSSIRFPTAFAGKERKVEITGEVYFEVTHNKVVPFRVVTNQQTIEVLGTHFNVNAYDDEGIIKTTLLEGSIKVQSTILKPGQQAEITRDARSGSHRVSIHNNVNIENVVAWKNGIFHFEGVDFGIIARQLARWYDVEVVYDKKINDLFYAEMPRHIKLSDALKALELTGKIRFDMQGKKIVVKQ